MVYLVHPSQEGIDSRAWTTSDWTRWLASKGVLRSVRRDEPGTCALCSGPTNFDYIGQRWPTCFACGRLYGPYVRRIVPISYGLTDGLTGIARQAKNEPTRTWLKVALASLLYDFLSGHLDCLEGTAGGPFHVVTIVPSHRDTRGGSDHLKEVVHSVTGWGDRIRWDLGLLTKTATMPADQRRQRVMGGLFVLTPGRTVRHQRILLIDDVCTSGATLASAAQALVAAGAERPVAVTLSRHVNVNDQYSDELRRQIQARGYEPTTCAVHLTRNPFIVAR